MKVDNEQLKALNGLRKKLIAFAVFFILVVGASISIIKNSIIKPEAQTEEIFTYTVNNKLDYKVYLNPNNYYESPYLEMDRQYATELVRMIEANLVNTITVSRGALIEYEYEVTGDINGTYTADTGNKKTELWNKHYVLVPKTKSSVTKKKNHSVKEKLEIDFNQYNQIVIDFKKELRLNIDANFDVAMKIDYKIKVGSEEVTKSDTITMSIPLTRNAFFIGNKVPEAAKETVYSTASLIINYIVLIPAIIFLIIAIILLINFIRKILKINQKTEYQTRLNKILKNYGEVIAQSETEPNCGKYDILDITHFEDLIDIENEVRIPIIYYEKQKDTEGWFTLVHGEQMYRYILYSNEKEQKIYEHTMQLKIP